MGYSGEKSEYTDFYSSLFVYARHNKHQHKSCGYIYILYCGRSGGLYLEFGLRISNS